MMWLVVVIQGGRSVYVRDDVANTVLQIDYARRYGTYEEALRELNRWYAEDRGHIMRIDETFAGIRVRH